MKRVTIILPADLKDEASRFAEELGISLSEAVRQLIEDWLEEHGRLPREDPLMDDSDVFDGSAPYDLSAQHDRHLYGEASDLH
jgi:antitoxin component of RelBE/YafQ-DinJ toxin-antitoxin module